MILYEITKKGLAIAGAVGAVVAGKELADVGEREYERDLRHKTSAFSRFAGNVTHGLIGTSDEEIERKARKAPLAYKIGRGLKYLVTKKAESALDKTARNTTYFSKGYKAD